MNVLFVCTANSGRSVIGERLLERDAGGRHHARSAGSMPGPAAHPEVIDALDELGIDAGDHVPQQLTPQLIDWADVVVATCDDSCPYVPGKHYVNWQLPDPKNQPIQRVREIRDDIAARVANLVRALDTENDLADVGPLGADRAQDCDAQRDHRDAEDLRRA